MIFIQKKKVWYDAMIADYWIIIASRPANFSLADLIAEEPVYAKFKSVIHQQVIFLQHRRNRLFCARSSEPEIMLKDLLFATHKMDNYQPKYFFLLR